MVLPYKLYIDSQGVKRGYYVYVHKDRATGEVFYVGKGNGKRAWETRRRNDKWKEKVASLTNGWDVKLVKEDLSEIEAFELEAELVEQYGGCAVDGGKLTNRVSGGENPLSIQFGIQFDDGGWSAAYYNARKFKEFPRGEEEMLVSDLNKELDTIISKLQHFEQEALDRNDEKLSDSVTDIDCLIGSLHDVSSDFLRNRVSWKDFALALEETLDDLESELEDITKYHKKVIPLLKQTSQITAKVLLEIDSGNRKEAEETATRMKRSDKAKPST
jgi:hypothetical protein